MGHVGGSFVRIRTFTYARYLLDPIDFCFLLSHIGRIRRQGGCYLCRNPYRVATND